MKLILVFLLVSLLVLHSVHSDEGVSGDESVEKKRNNGLGTLESGNMMKCPEQFDLQEKCYQALCDVVCHSNHPGGLAFCPDADLYKCSCLYPC